MAAVEKAERAYRKAGRKYITAWNLWKLSPTAEYLAAAQLAEREYDEASRAMHRAWQTESEA